MRQAGHKPGRKESKMYSVIVKNVWTGEQEIVETANSAYLADRIAARTMRRLDADHVAYMEPVDGWDAEKARADAIAADWEAWHRLHPCKA
jgi:hypothetical protein